jgi:hypothetical protein
MILSHDRFTILFAGFMLALLGLNGCGGDPTPTLAPDHNTASATAPAVSATIPPASATAQQVTPATPAIARATGTSTPRLIGTATSTSRPTRTRRSATKTPTAISPSRTVRPTADPAEPPKFPPDVNPLTGLEVSDTEVLERAPLAIKVSNAPAVVRPQAGLDKADLVFEHYAEGGVTRLTAVFLGQTPTMVGSVRSGRLLDLEIPAMFKALFAYSGTSAGVGEKYRKSDLWPDQMAPPGNAGGAFYRRDLPKAFEHTLFVNPSTLWAEAERRGINERKDLRAMTFDPTPPRRGKAASEVSVLYRAGISQVKWVYNPRDGRYYRWQGGAAHREELSGTQLSAANVIVVAANHVETNIVEDTWGGGHWSIEIQIWGEGPVSIFRDGKRYDGIWRRLERDAPLSFWTQDGKRRIPLKPGNSWFQMVPLGFTGLEVSP